MSAATAAPALGVTCVLPGIWAVASSTLGNAPYIVKAEYDEACNVRWSCTCPHHTFHPDAPDKHIAAVKADPTASRYIRRCVTCRLDEAMDGCDQCEGCEAVYPGGQEAALAAELAMERALHPVQRPILPAAWLPSAATAGFVRCSVVTPLDDLVAVAAH